MTIYVENLSKKYVINHTRHLESETLKERMTAGLSRMFKGSKGDSNIVDTTEDFWALQDINFSLDQGDRLAVIGRNGAGKSTLLKIISRITPPTGGRITIKGKVASLLEVGTGFHPELTGKENIYLNGALLGMSKIEIKKKFDEIVNFSEIEKFLDTPVKRYSSGMFVRLGFAVAAHLSPEILVIDEALAVGDMQFKKKCIAKLEDVGKEGRTIIFVTHDMWALRFCNKGVLLENGCVVPTENLEECVARYSGSSVQKNEKNKWIGHFECESIVIHQFEFIPSSLPDVKNGKVMIRITLLEEMMDLFVGFMIFNQYGNKIVHHKISHDEGISINLSAGSYEFESELDIEMFSEGVYRVELDVGFYDFKRVSHAGISISFEVSRPDKKYGEPTDTILTGWKGGYQKIGSIS